MLQAFTPLSEGLQDLSIAPAAGPFNTIDGLSIVQIAQESAELFGSTQTFHTQGEGFIQTMHRSTSSPGTVNGST